MKRLAYFILPLLFCYNAWAQDDRPPRTEDSEEIIMDEEVDPDAFFIDHKLTRGETMIMVSRKYMIDPKDIYEYNDWAVNGLEQNMVLKIPLHKSKKKDLEGFKKALEKQRGGPIQVPAPPKKKKEIETEE